MNECDWLSDLFDASLQLSYGPIVYLLATYQHTLYYTYIYLLYLFLCVYLCLSV